MITIRALASSSAGNAYLIDDGKTKILIEAGIRYKDIQIGADFQMSQIAACLVTHEHQDHCKSVKEVMRAGIDVYASQGTLNALGLDGHRACAVKALQPIFIGTWAILPFDAQHDVSEPMGFLLANKSGEKLVFLTDTYYCKHKFEGLTHIMVECNYSLKLLDENIAAGLVPLIMRNRLLKSHFSLENMKEFLLANDLSKVVEIHLLHLSDSNSDEELFKREVQELTGKQIYIASRN